jgi:RHS repeat-associated protein
VAVPSLSNRWLSLVCPDGKSDCSNSYLFTGRRLDILDNGSLKIQYNRNRYYDSYTGRWLTHDPLGITPNPQWPNEFNPVGQYRGGQNLYLYAMNNPMTQDDPFGLDYWGDHDCPWNEQRCKERYKEQVAKLGNSLLKCAGESVGPASYSTALCVGACVVGSVAASGPGGAIVTFDLCFGVCGVAAGVIESVVFGECMKERRFLAASLKAGHKYCLCKAWPSCGSTRVCAERHLDIKLPKPNLLERIILW